MLTQLLPRHNNIQHWECFQKENKYLKTKVDLRVGNVAANYNLKFKVAPLKWATHQKKGLF